MTPITARKRGPTGCRWGIHKWGEGRLECVHCHIKYNGPGRKNLHQPNCGDGVDCGPKVMTEEHKATMRENMSKARKVRTGRAYTLLTHLNYPNTRVE